MYRQQLLRRRDYEIDFPSFDDLSLVEKQVGNATPVLRVKGLSKSYGATAAVAGVSLIFARVRSLACSD
jgi:hypothetical protein